MEHITAAGNVEIPAYLALLRDGFRVERQTTGKDSELWIAERDALRLSGSSPIQLLGLYHMRTQRGENWQAEDAEIDAFLGRFYPD